MLANEHLKETFVERMAGESPNDRNDRAIRTAARWLQEHIVKTTALAHIRVILLSEDAENVRKAKEMGVEALGVLEYVSGVTSQPHLVDLVAKFGQSGFEGVDGVETSSKPYYSEHLPAMALKRGVESGRYQQGTFHASRDNLSEGFVAVPGGEQWLFVRGRAGLNRAVEGDLVAVEVLPREEWSGPSGVVEERENMAGWKEMDCEEGSRVGSSPSIADRRPTCRVVGVVRRRWRPYCGTLLPSADVTAPHHVFLPADKRIPLICITTQQAATLLGKRIVVSMDEWRRSSLLPQGHFVRVLGDIGDKEAENEVLLLEHDVPYQPFSAAVLADLPSSSWSIPEDEVANRADLQHLAVCSVDPPGCTDIDDALHCRTLEGGNLEVGVHIADVSYFIRPGSAVDKEAAERGTTVYLCDKRIDMVPEVLSSNLCSLREGEVRLAFSVIWEMTPAAEVLSTSFMKSIIKSRRAFTYAEAQMRIDDKSLDDDVTLSLRHLNSLAKVLKQKRIDAGALTLASPEVRFEIDSETHDPIELESKEMKETNSLVEEFMLLANISVARKTKEEFPHCAVLRRHPAPPLSNYEVLIKAGAAKGVHIAVETAKVLATSLAEANLAEEPYFNTLLRILATRCMMQALYFSSGKLPEAEYFHYGLATPIYTHFTSPIRRYADLMVHRLLAAAIGADATYPALVDKEAGQALCNRLNHRHKMAQQAQRASIQLHTQLFFKGRAVTEEAFVLMPKKNSLQVILPKYGFEGHVFLDGAVAVEDSTSTSFNTADLTLTVHGHTFRVFDRILVWLEVQQSSLQDSHLTITLVSPSLPGLVEGVGSVGQKNTEEAGSIGQSDSEGEGPSSKRTKR